MADATTKDDIVGSTKNNASAVLRSAHESGMESSIFRFKDVNFVVPAKHGDKVIVQNISGTVKWGHVLAIMGPSGAGKVRQYSTLWLKWCKCFWFDCILIRSPLKKNTRLF
jgi:ABC-type dipeptide/oligopeptide/nickel transport system ATPase subunit